ncbi:O-antigen ligase family protein [Bacteroides salyersiae]|uniref:O-antigen ligase family protein n=1 Tax=Bacteroides salyersiae TaxID=291644 RepID=UPI001C8C2CB5|nr:O-antigen ligase family protein [Bacteroides salyersiae]
MNAIVEFERQWLMYAQEGVCFALSTILLLFIYPKNRNMISDFYVIVVWTFILCGGKEAIYGLLQIYDLASSNHSLFKLTGSFLNPGPYSGYLAIVFPICLFECLRLNKIKVPTFVQRVGFYLSGSVLVLILCILLAGISRSAWMAVIVSSLWICGKYYSWKTKLKKVWELHRLSVIGIIGVGLIVLLIAGVIVFDLKKNSANGRFFMWKIGCLAVKHRPLGYGVGRFVYAYGKEQEMYFSQGRYSSQEEFVAGSPEYAFNEYLQVAIEQGIVFLLLMLFVIGKCLCLGIKKNRLGICGGGISLMVFAFSSYPMQIPTLAISSIFLIMTCVIGSSRVGMCFFALLIGSMSFYIWKYNVYDECKEWENTHVLYDMGAYESAKAGYRKLYPTLKNRGTFLFEYGHTLHKLKEYSVSTAILQEAIYYSSDPMILNIIGKNYQRQKKYNIAERYFIRSIHRLPGRIYPYYLLAKLYAESGAVEKMREMAELVLTKEPKVPSTAIEEMKQEVEILMKESFESVY